MGKHPCIAWVPTLLGKCRRDLYAKNKAKDRVCAIEGPIPHLPYDIIINILSRLPAKCIFKLWQSKSNDLLHDLTTTPHFIRTHLDRATPTIVVQSLIKSGNNDEIKLFLFDGKAKATSFDLSSCNNAYCNGPFILWGSYDAFLLFKSAYGPMPYFCILNPITKEQVILTSAHLFSYVCGFYSHPHKKEYEVIRVCDVVEQIWDFQILNLRTKHRRSVGSWPFPPSRKHPPVFINGTFYWMVDWCLYLAANRVSPSLSESIVSYNLETGEFSTMEVFKPFSDSPQPKKYPEEEFHLFEMEGELSLFGTSSAHEVGIWVWSYDKCWVKKHPIMSPDQERHWNFKSYFRDFEYIKMKGEFIAYDHEDRDKQPLIYNLRLGTWKLFKRKGFEGDRFVITSHTHSLVSLDVTDSVISLQC